MLLISRLKGEIRGFTTSATTELVKLSDETQQENARLYQSQALIQQLGIQVTSTDHE